MGFTCPQFNCNFCSSAVPCSDVGVPSLSLSRLHLAPYCSLLHCYSCRITQCFFLITIQILLSSCGLLYSVINENSISSKRLRWDYYPFTPVKPGKYFKYFILFYFYHLQKGHSYGDHSIPITMTCFHSPPHPPLDMRKPTLENSVKLLIFYSLTSNAGCCFTIWLRRVLM